MVLEREMYGLTNEELCELWCGQVEEDFEYEYDERGKEYEDNK